MKTQLFAHVAAATSLFLCAVTTYAAQPPVASTATVSQVSITADPGAWRRDPFIGSLKSGSPAPAVKVVIPKTAAGQNQVFNDEIQLQGIMSADKTFHALINGRTVKTGDRIGGVTINHISRYQVVVLNERKEKVIYDIYQGRIDRGKK